MMSEFSFNPQVDEASAGSYDRFRLKNKKVTVILNPEMSHMVMASLRETRISCDITRFCGHSPGMAQRAAFVPQTLIGNHRNLVNDRHHVWIRLAFTGGDSLIALLLLPSRGGGVLQLYYCFQDGNETCMTIKTD